MSVYAAGVDRAMFLYGYIGTTIYNMQYMQCALRPLRLTTPLVLPQTRRPAGPQDASQRGPRGRGPISTQQSFRPASHCMLMPSEKPLPHARTLTSEHTEPGREQVYPSFIPAGRFASFHLGTPHRCTDKRKGCERVSTNGHAIKYCILMKDTEKIRRQKAQW